MEYFLQDHTLETDEENSDDYELGIAFLISRKFTKYFFKK